VFGCVVASEFEATIATHPFGNTPEAEFYWWDFLLIVARPQDCKKQQFATSWAEKLMNGGSWVFFNEQWSMLHCSWVSSMNSSTVSAGPIRFNIKNALNRVRSNKIKNIFLIFHCVLFKKLMLNIIQWHYKLDGDRLMM